MSPAPSAQEVALRARLYELIHRGTPGDVSLYVELARGVGSVLELGCGAGRVLGPVARVCDRAVGVDVSAAMLERARERLAASGVGGVRLVQADLARPLELGARFDLVLFPYNGLFALPDLAAMRQCLRTARQHLRPGGALALDVYIPDLSEATPPPAGAPFEHLMTVVDGGAGAGVVDVFERLVPLPGAQRFGMEFRYDIHPPLPPARAEGEGARDGDGGGGDTRASARGAPGFRRLYEVLAHRWLHPEQLSTLLHEAGFVVEHRWGDFARGPVTPDSEQLVVLARRA